MATAWERLSSLASQYRTEKAYWEQSAAIMKGIIAQMDKLIHEGELTWQELADHGHFFPAAKLYSRKSGASISRAKELIRSYMALTKAHKRFLTILSFTGEFCERGCGYGPCGHGF